jgi:hypothetical protein
MRRTIGVVALALLAGCGPGYQNVVSSYVGSPEGDLISSWGVPDSTYRGDDGARYLTYRSSRTLQPMDGVKLRARCVTTFKVEDGKVKSASFQGNDCR